MRIAGVAVLEGAPLADFDCDGVRVRREAFQGWRQGPGEGREAADDAEDIVLVLGTEVLDGRDALGPESEEGDEYGGAVGEGEVMSRGGFFLVGERDGRGSGCAPQRSEIETQRGPWWEVGNVGLSIRTDA